ncbi:hypothetical protein [Streptosporangium sp. NPDC006007]|uniref:hypothetical protein n=1 Tax=Streptosporangium sp. NPDC006007 TaxID=3154575 RepID=UPI0033BA77FE
MTDTTDADGHGAARRRLVERYGTDHHRRWAADPNGPAVPPADLLARVLSAAWPADRQGSTPAPAPPAEDLLAALELLAPARHRLDGLELTTITAARTAGATWKQIAASLGLDSPQAAAQRHARLAGREGPSQEWNDRLQAERAEQALWYADNPPDDPDFTGRPKGPDA